MALEQQRRVGIRGLNLGVDSAQAAEGVLTLADGVRYLEAGAAHSRNGRVRAGLSFPSEGASIDAARVTIYGAGVTPYTQTIAHLVAPGRVRGAAPFYDQRLETRHKEFSFTADAGTDQLAITAHGFQAFDPVRVTAVVTTTGITVGAIYYAEIIDANTIRLRDAPGYDSVVIDIALGGTGTIESVRGSISGAPFDIPQRLNFAYKANGKFYLNDDFVGSGSGIIDGDGAFNSTQTKAKIIVHGERAFIIDESTDPKVFQRRPKAEQQVLQRIKYDIRRAGIVWPTLNAHKPTASVVVSGSTTLPVGVYRFRVILENKNGTQSSPSMPHTVSHSNESAFVYHYVRWDAIIATFPGGPNAISKVRVFVQFQAAGTEALEPSAYVFVKSVTPTSRDDAADVLGSIRYTRTDHDSLSVHPLMPLSNSAPPRLTDMVVVNEVAYGWAADCEIYREVPIAEGENLVGVYGPTTYLEQTGYDPYNQEGVYRQRHRGDAHKLYDNTTIKPTRVSRNYLFWGIPEGMENWIYVGSSSEVGVGVAALGATCIAFTNQAIYSFNGSVLRRVYSKVGCASRDSIVETEQGIRFLGSDGVPRIFNGATVDEISNELLPIFDREDYTGDYVLRFDRANAQECQGTFGDRKFYFTFPVTYTQSNSIPGTYIDPNPQRFLAIGDASRGPTAWTIDRPGGYEMVYWLGRESRLLGITTGGEFYFLEEGFADQKQVQFADDPVYFDMKFRKFASAGGLQGQFYRVAIDANTQGQVLTAHFQCDDVPGLVYSTTFSTTRRDEFKTYLPAKFKGRFLDVRIFGTVSSRVAVYGAIVELAPRGVF